MLIVGDAGLAFGVRAVRDPAQQAIQQARLDRLRSELGPGLPFDDQAAIAFSSLRSRTEPRPVSSPWGSLTMLVAASGRDPRRWALDVMIAATAYVHNAGVFTRNGEDLAGIEPLVAIVTP